MSGDGDIPLVLVALIETLHRLDSVASMADSIPSVDAPSPRGAPGLVEALDRLVDQCDRLQQRAADHLRELSGSVDQVIVVLASAGESERNDRPVGLGSWGEHR